MESMSRLAVDTPEAPVERSKGVLATWRYTLASILFVFLVLYLVLFLILPIEQQQPSWRMAATAILVAASFCTALPYLWFFKRGLGGGLPGTSYTVLLFVPAVAIAVLGLIPPSYSIAAFLPLWLAVNCVAVLVPSKARWGVLAAGLAGAAGYAVIAAGLSSSEALPAAADRMFIVVLYGAMMPLMLVGGIWWWDVVVQLERSRRASGQLAVAKERLRFASDLHDIQGHHLQVIALKTELAARLLDKDPEAARVQILEAQSLARTALEDTRALVRGYRQVGLQTEATNAADVLEAAGIRAEVRITELPLAADAQTLFGLVIREATTNILRHSEARTVSVELEPIDDSAVLIIRNDGAGPAAAGTDGTGLLGLGERFTQAGGSVRSDTVGSEFMLTAALPLQPSGLPGEEIR
jgi:two-component system, NarL family, sensor histidine kinase DesK